MDVNRSLVTLAQLVRLPNVFTVWADIGMAALVTAALPDEFVRFVLLLLASTFLYWAGMVWNDYFDREQDAKERPFRPLPSGRIRTRQAAVIGVILMIAGLACAFLASEQAGTLATLLVAMILLYDSWLKRTWAGPPAMGACRFLNVVLGLSISSHGTESWGIVLALVVGVYITGVTWFARTEALDSQPNSLLWAAAVMLAALVLVLVVPSLAQRQDDFRVQTSVLFPYLIVIFGFYVGIPMRRAIARPHPDRVQTAVKRAILGLIVLDAILATGLAGIDKILLALLVVPAFMLGRRLYST